MAGEGQVAMMQFSTMTLENARKAKVSMENFYENLLVQDRDRSNRFGNPVRLVLLLIVHLYKLVCFFSRWKKLELSMEEMGLSSDEVSVWCPFPCVDQGHCGS